MNIYIWHRIGQASAMYHSGGGVVVVADTEARARALANANDGTSIAPEELPDHVLGTSSTDELVLVFPDAGCC